MSTDLIRTLNKNIIQFLRDNISDPINRGSNFIYYGYPRVDSRFPRISVLQADASGVPIGVGNSIQRYQILYDIDVWCDTKTKSVIAGHTYSGSEMMEYLSDQIILAFSRNKQSLLNDYSIIDVELTTANTLPYDEEFDIWRKSLSFRITVDKD